MRDVEIVSVDVEYGPTLGGNEITRPCRTRGEMTALRLTVPLKPLRPVMVAVNVAVEPRGIDCDEGVIVIVKSGGGGLPTVTDTDRVWHLLIVRLQPVTVTR